MSFVEWCATMNRAGYDVRFFADATSDYMNFTRYGRMTKDNRPVPVAPPFRRSVVPRGYVAPRYYGERRPSRGYY